METPRPKMNRPADAAGSHETAIPRVESRLDRLETRLRPEPWEDDLSRNTLDVAPFENLPPISSRGEEEFQNASRLFPAAIWETLDLPAMAAKDTYPIPSPADREGYSPGYDVNYWGSGLSDYLKIMEAANRLGVSVDRVFDFGCASGRVIRHFLAQSNVSEVWGSDINQRHIRWLYEHLPERIVPVFNHTLPMLPCEDNYFDVVSAFSVFTHIDTFETAWLAELRRILKPGGMAYLTVHNESTWEILRGELTNENNRLVQSIRKVEPDFDRIVMGPLPETRTVYRFTQQGPYRAQVFHSDVFLKRVWSRFFEIVDILPRHHVRQTVVLLRKRSTGETR